MPGKGEASSDDIMVHFLHTDADLHKALKLLVKTDPRLKPVLEKAGRPDLRRRPAGFPGLCAIVVSQQLSTSSARAIWSRLEAAFDPFHHDAVRRARAPTLARLGLSKPKIKTLKALSKTVSQGLIDLEAIAGMPADDAHNALIGLHGVGPWTADIYLLFCLGHADAFPAGDLALQEAARLAFGLNTRPDAKQMVQLAEAWRPYRGVAAHLLWAYYAAIKRRDPVAAPAKTEAKK
jgi:DNA-3-methyladenine glycosylase II